jgi:hypothetical protein
MTWASAFLFATSYAICLSNFDGGNPLRMGEALYGGSAMDVRDAKTSNLPQSSMKTSIKKAIKSMGRVASFDTGDDMFPLEELMKTGQVSRSSAKKLPKQILRGISAAASFHPGGDFQVLKGCKPQNKAHEEVRYRSRDHNLDQRARSQEPEIVDRGSGARLCSHNLWEFSVV